MKCDVIADYKQVFAAFELRGVRGVVANRHLNKMLQCLGLEFSQSEVNHFLKLLDRRRT